MEDFLDIVLPSLLLLAFCVFTGSVIFWFAWSRIRLWNAESRRIEAAIRSTRQFTKEATSVLIDIINDPGSDDTLRNKAITAYSKVNNQDGLENEK